MRVFHSTYKDRSTGETIATRNWYVELRDHRNIIRRLPAFTDKAASEALGRTLLKLVENKQSGEPLTVELSRWLEGQSDSTKATLARWGLIDQTKLTGSKTLAEHIADWKANLLARGNTRQHANLSAGRVERVAADCGFRFCSDISAAKVQQCLADYRKDTLDAKGNLERGLSIQSTNFYLVCAKSFCRWMMREHRATTNPIEYLDGQNVATDRRHVRRMLSPADMAKLLTAAQAGPERYGMSGTERALLYELAATTGLRVSELASLTVGSFSLGNSPGVTIAAKSAKNRQAATLPLRADMAAKLAAFTATKLPTAAVFPRLSRFNAARIIRVDLESAGIPYTDASNGIFDFHALRHQFISNLAAAGVHPKTAQELARHSDIKLTMNRYTHVFRGELDKAVDLLPDYGAEQARQANEAKATGTDGQPTATDCAPLAPVAATASLAMRLTDSVADENQGLKTPLIKPGENSLRDYGADNGPKRLAFCLALSDGKPRTSANLDELKGVGMMQSQSPMESTQNVGFIGDSDGGRRCSSTAEQRFCKP